MISEKIRNLIDSKIKIIEEEPFLHCIDVSNWIKKLNKHINSIEILTTAEIENLLINLVQYNISLNIPIEKGTIVVRGRKTNLNKTLVQDLSYIPQNSDKSPQIGRMNKDKQSLFYAVLSKDFLHINVALSEIDVEEQDKVNILKSTFKEDLSLRYIGIQDYYARNTEPPFPVNPLFKKIFKYYDSKCTRYAITAISLCDAFFCDILTRPNHGHLYEVTSILANIFMEDSSVDGLIYPSVKSKGSPNIVLKTDSVDSKLKHIEALSVLVEKDYGYSWYELPTIAKGTINNTNIKWDNC